MCFCLQTNARGPIMNLPRSRAAISIGSFLPFCSFFKVFAYGLCFMLLLFSIFPRLVARSFDSMEINCDITMTAVEFCFDLARLKFSRDLAEGQCQMTSGTGKVSQSWIFFFLKCYIYYTKSIVVLKVNLKGA